MLVVERDGRPWHFTLKHLGPKVFVALEAIFSILGLDYDREKVAKLRGMDMH
jgi:hypothetical protein